MLQLSNPPPLPPIADLARPELKLGGLRLDPAHRMRARAGHRVAVDLIRFDITALLTGGADYDNDDSHSLRVPLPEGDARARRIQGFPEGALLGSARWSPDSRRVAVTVRTDGQGSRAPRGPAELWVADLPTSEKEDAPVVARRVLTDLNLTIADWGWCPDSLGLLAHVVPPAYRAPPPERPEAPPGPVVQCNASGVTSQNRTYQASDDSATTDQSCGVTASMTLEDSLPTHTHTQPTHTRSFSLNSLAGSSKGPTRRDNVRPSLRFSLDSR